MVTDFQQLEEINNKLVQCTEVRTFKLDDRMRSMRTNGASKNRDCPGHNGMIYKITYSLLLSLRFLEVP